MAATKHVTFVDTLHSFFPSVDDTEIEAHFSPFDTISVHWEPEPNTHSFSPRWCDAMVVACMSHKKAYVVYPANTLTFYFGKSHPAMYILHDLDKMMWTWASMSSQWEYDMAVNHTKSMRRAGGRHVVSSYLREPLVCPAE